VRGFRELQCATRQPLDGEAAAGQRLEFHIETLLLEIAFVHGD
jgi:hypothetical protein